jgi:ParB-like chromosome segregation protein Spo0J
MNALFKHDAIKELEIHPLAELLPEMSEEEFKAFCEDIKANGLRTKITVHEGKVLEGRHRYKAMLKVRKWDLKDDCFELLSSGINPLDYVLSMNVARRHLDTSQRAVIGAKLVTATLGFNQHKKGGITAEQAAAMLNVSVSSIETAKVILEKGAKEVVEQVQAGTLALGKAKGIVKRPSPTKGGKASIRSKEEQLVELNKPKADTGDQQPVTPASTEASDNIDELENAYVAGLKVLKKHNVENAAAAVAQLVGRLQDLDFLQDYRPETTRKAA